MRKLILIIAFFSTITFGQQLLMFGNLEGNLRDLANQYFITSNGDVLDVLGGKFTLTQTGAQVQVILNGTFSTDVSLPIGKKLILDNNNDFLYAPVDGRFDVVVEGTTIIQITSNEMRGADVGAFLLDKDPSTLANPTYSFRNDPNTGVHTPATGEISLVANGIEIAKAQVDGMVYIVHTDNVSNPPTAAELTTAFGAPGTVGSGFVAYIDDAGAGANFYKVVSDGTNWWIFTGTKAL